MAESKSIDQWQELVKSCNESGKSKAAFCPANLLKDHQFLYGCTKLNNKTHPLIPVRITNANEPLAIIRLSNGSTGGIKRGVESHYKQFDVILSCIKKIWQYLAVVDFRKLLFGLMELIVDALDKDPASGELFLDRFRAGNKLMVYFDGSCFWLLYCRLEKGSFKLPDPTTDVFTLSHNQLQWLLSGINFMTQRVKKPIKYSIIIK